MPPWLKIRLLRTMFRRTAEHRPAFRWWEPFVCIWVLALLALGWSDPSFARAALQPAEISEAERVGVELALNYLSEGAAAWQRELRPGNGASAELLEVMVGPAEGAVWRLVSSNASNRASSATFLIEYPSGLEEILTLDIDGDAERRIVGIRTGSQTVRGPARGGSGNLDPDNPQLEASEAGFKTQASSADQDTLGQTLSPGTLSLGLWIAAAALWGFSWLDRRARPYFLGAAAVVALIAVGVVAGWVPEDLLPSGGPGTTADTSETSSENRPRDVLELRRALAMGDGAAARRAQGRLADPNGWPVIVWRAQEALARADLSQAKQLLQRASARGDSPFLHRLEARLAVEELREIEAALAYQKMMAGNEAPAVWVLEAAEVFAVFGMERQRQDAEDLLGKMAARDAGVYYYLAKIALTEGLRGKSARLFRRAWDLEPLPRSDLLSDYLLAHLTTSNAELRGTLDFGSFEEKPIPCAESDQRPMRIGSRVSASNVGDLLILEVGSSRLEIQAGCGLAPESTVPQAADRWRGELDKRLLRDLPDPKSADVAGIDRRRWSTALAPLARQQRWQELVDVADAVEAYDRRAEKAADPDVLRHHATALEKLGRRRDAARKLIQLAEISQDQRRVDPSALLQLSEILVKEQEYDRALGLIKKALDAIPFETSGQRLLQVEMEKRLFRSSQEHLTEHFRLVYPPSRTFLFAEKATAILEAERKRLLPWLPQPKDAPRVDVLFLDVSDFYDSYAGQQILGLYDGRIRVPLGEVQRFDPFVVSLMTHELAHAMIATATNDRAPYWLHEGLAQHLEMPQTSVNPIPELERAGSRLSFPLIEIALSERAVPSLVQIGYDQARWTAHYLDSRYGKKGIRGLLAAFKNGKSTEQAIEQVLGLEPARFDAQLRAWSLQKAPATWPSKVIDYDPEASDLISRE